MTHENSSSLNMIPLSDRVAVEVLDKVTKTASGIILTTAVERKTGKGKVVAVGGGVWHNDAQRPPEVCEGDVVVYTEGVGTSVTLKGKDYLLLREHDILGVLDV